MNAIFLDSSYFCVVVVCDENWVVTKPAPIVGYMRGWTKDKVEQYATKKGWSIEFREIG